MPLDRRRFQFLGDLLHSVVQRLEARRVVLFIDPPGLGGELGECGPKRRIFGRLVPVILARRDQARDAQGNDQDGDGDDSFQGYRRE